MKTSKAIELISSKLEELGFTIYDSEGWSNGVEISPNEDGTIHLGCFLDDGYENYLEKYEGQDAVFAAQARDNAEVRKTLDLYFPGVFTKPARCEWLIGDPMKMKKVTEWSF